MYLKLFDGCAIFESMNQGGLRAEKAGILTVGDTAVRLTRDSVSPLFPSDGELVMTFRPDGGQIVPVLFARVRNGRITPNVYNADIVNLYAKMLELSQEIEKLKSNLQTLEAKTDADLLGSIF